MRLSTLLAAFLPIFFATADSGDANTEDAVPSFEQLSKTAEQGDAEAQLNLGHMYRKGEGVAQDFTKAVQWYRKVAEQDHAKAQYNLGVMYYIGRGVTQSYEEAFQWFDKALEQGLLGFSNPVVMFD